MGNEVIAGKPLTIYGALSQNEAQRLLRDLTVYKSKGLGNGPQNSLIA